MTNTPADRAEPARVDARQAEKIKRRLAARSTNGDGCWLWQGCRDQRSGYGRISFGGGKRTWLAHRLSLLAELGELPRGALVLHTCDVRACVRPSHLYLGTALDNSRDRGERTGWSGNAPGVANGMAKLDDDSVRELRRRASAGESRTSLGRAFGVSRQTASDIVDRKLWRHIE